MCVLICMCVCATGQCLNARLKYRVRLCSCFLKIGLLLSLPTGGFISRRRRRRRRCANIFHPLLLLLPLLLLKRVLCMECALPFAVAAAFVCCCCCFCCCCSDMPGKPKWVRLSSFLKHAAPPTFRRRHPNLNGYGINTFVYVEILQQSR